MMLLTVEMNDREERVGIYFDDEGLRILRHALDTSLEILAQTIMRVLARSNGVTL